MYPYTLYILPSEITCACLKYNYNEFYVLLYLNMNKVKLILLNKKKYMIFIIDFHQELEYR